MQAFRCAAWLIAALLAGAQPQARAQATLDLEPFVRPDRYETIKISPDGAHLAATVRLEDRTGLVLLSRAERKVVSSAAGYRNSAVQDFWWVDNDRVLIAMAESYGSKDMLYSTGELHALEVGGKRVKRVFGPRETPGVVDSYGAREPYEHATVADPRPGASEVLISTWMPGPTSLSRIERMSVENGRRTRVATAPVHHASFTLDPAGAVRFAEGSDLQNVQKLYYRENDAAEWRLVNDLATSGIVARAVGMASDGVTAYVQVSTDDGPDAIEAWDMRSLARKVLLRDPVVDPAQILYDRDDRTPIGARYIDEGPRLRFFDEAAPTAKTYRMLEKAFQGAAVAITSTTADGKLALLHVWSDRTPGDYYLFDLDKRTADIVFTAREWFHPEAVPAQRRIELEARDGTSLRGYLTLPHEGGERDLPMVVMPHGGPYGIHDSWGFDLDTHLLASAGYAVLRVNFRGSGNYGRPFRLLGARQWGGTMQDDLSDATRWAIAQGIADPRRICIAGASYGGYAALMGVAREPDLYRCAVGYIGVYDLPAMQAEDSRYAGWLRNWSIDWIGERETLAARSPVNLASRIKVPVFLVAGGKDTRAPLYHSRRMERALRDAGIEVQTLYIDSEGHGFRNKDNRRAYYRQLLDFLSGHLGGAKGG